MKHLYPLILGILSALGSAQAQYDTVFVGTAETISNGPFETPFPTSGAVTSRTQYLFSYTELNGLFPTAWVEGVVIDLLTDDPPGTTVDLLVRMKNTTTQTLTLPEYTDVAPRGLLLGQHLNTGTLAIPFNIEPFPWVGPGFNVVLEFDMQRSGVPGLDPQVALDTSFTWTPAHYMHDSALVSVFTLTALNAEYAAPFGSRPVVGFLVAAASVGYGEEKTPSRVAVYPNPATDRLRLRVLDPVDELTAQVFNTQGALVLDRSKLVPDPAGFVDLALPSLPSGCYLLRIASEGAAIWEQRFVVE